MIISNKLYTMWCSMDIEEMVTFTYILMLLSNKLGDIKVITMIGKIMLGYLTEIEKEIFSIKTLSLSTFDMFDLMRYRYMKAYRQQCDSILRLRENLLVLKW